MNRNNSVTSITDSLIDLRCIIINHRYKVLARSFELTVPRRDGCGILAYLRIASPLLSDKDPSILCIHKPLSTISGRSTTELNESQVDLRDCVDTMAEVQIEFPKRRGSTSRVNVIICVDNIISQDTFFYPLTVKDF